MQKVQIKGIVSGLSVAEIGDLQYKIYNDQGEEQPILLWNSLHVPHCMVHHICPWQIGAKTKHPLDGFNALSEHPVLTVNGKRTTITYDSIFQLPLIYTTPGIYTYERYSCALSLILNYLPHRQNYSTYPNNNDLKFIFTKAVPTRASTI